MCMQNSAEDQSNLIGEIVKPIPFVSSSLLGVTSVFYFLKIIIRKRIQE